MFTSKIQRAVTFRLHWLLNVQFTLRAPILLTIQNAVGNIALWSCLVLFCAYISGSFSYHFLASFLDNPSIQPNCSITAVPREWLSSLVSAINKKYKLLWNIHKIFSRLLENSGKNLKKTFFHLNILILFMLIINFHAILLKCLNSYANYGIKY